MFTDTKHEKYQRGLDAALAKKKNKKKKGFKHLADEESMTEVK